MTANRPIEPTALARVCGGQTTTPSAPAAPPPRTWGQVAADYTAACVSSAATSLVFQGRPTSWQQAAITAGIGCATGLANRAAQDWVMRGAR